MKKHESHHRRRRESGPGRIYPIFTGIRTAGGRIAIPRAASDGIITRLTAAGAHVGAHATIESGAVKFKSTALRGIDCATSQLILGIAEGLRATSLLKLPKGPASLAGQLSGPPANIRATIPAFGPKGLPAGILGFGARGGRHLPRLSPGDCATILAQVNQYAATAAAAYNTAQADYQSADGDMQQSYAIDPTGAMVINNLTTWTQLQGFAASGIASLNDIQAQANVANQAAANALLFENVACANIDQIQQAISAATAAANNTTNTQNSLGSLLLMGYFLGNQGIPKPAPPPPLPPITPACLTAVPMSALGVTYGVTVMIDETCTQSLLKTMQTYCGTPSLSNYLTEIGGVITGVAAAVATSATVIGAVSGVVGAAVAAMKAECQLIQQIIPEADNHGRGIAMHFSAIPVLGTAALWGTFGGLWGLINEGTLIAETQVSGGFGDGIVDGFWITGN